MGHAENNEKNVCLKSAETKAIDILRSMQGTS